MVDRGQAVIVVVGVVVEMEAVELVIVSPSHSHEHLSWIWICLSVALLLLRQKLCFQISCRVICFSVVVVVESGRFQLKTKVDDSLIFGMKVKVFL